MNLNDKVKTYWEAGPCGTEDDNLKNLTPLSKPWFEAIERIRYEKEPMIHEAAQFTRYKGKRVLEVGVGAGTDHLQWARSGADLYGVDLTDAAIETTKKRLALYDLHSNLQRIDAEQLPFEDSFFDVVYSWGVIHHSEKPQKIVKEIHRILKPSGEVIAMFYSKASVRVWKYWVKHALLKGKFQSPATVMWNHMESIGTKCYYKKELRQMFSSFSSVEIKKAITPYDLTYIPKALRNLIPEDLGFFMIVKAKK